MARQAIALEPRKSLYLESLGAALYGVGRYAEAIDVLERSLKAGRGQTDAFELFFLAMSHRGLGRPGQALMYFDRGVRWLDGKKELAPKHVRELTTFRAEARAVLAGPGGDLPADVFAPP